LHANLYDTVSFENVQAGNLERAKALALPPLAWLAYRQQQILAKKRTQHIRFIVLKDTRCPTLQEKFYGELLCKRLGQQFNLFNIDG